MNAGPDEVFEREPGYWNLICPERTGFGKLAEWFHHTQVVGWEQREHGFVLEHVSA